MGPLLGRGIFVTDGDEWAHSRALLRPNFAKDQIAGLGMIDRHFGELMALPRPHVGAGPTVDLQLLLMRVIPDTATGFLFNKSTRNPPSTPSATLSSSRSTIWPSYSDWGLPAGSMARAARSRLRISCAGPTWTASSTGARR